MKYAQYSSGLNEFRYCGAIHASHPVSSIEELNALFELAPTQVREQGYGGRNYWQTELSVIDGEAVEEFLVRSFHPFINKRQFFSQFTAGGGHIECFLGIISSRLCDQSFSPDLLRLFADLGIHLRIDFHQQ